MYPLGRDERRRTLPSAVTLDGSGDEALSAWLSTELAIDDAPPVLA